jgi:DNA-binding HTH domain-containing proteins
MRIFVYSILIAAGVSLLGACNPQPEAPKLLAEAERLIESNPDSAMRLIDSLFYPERSLSRDRYMRYLVTRVQARYKNHRDIAEDTLVFDARDYFNRHTKDPRQTALALFYSGCVYREQRDYGQAMEHYKEAEKYALQTGDADLKGLVQYNMGDLFAEQGLYTEALKNYKDAERFYMQSPEKPYEKQANCLSAIGQMYALLNHMDSAFISFHKGLELAENKGDNKLQGLLAQNLSVVYKETNQFEKAETYLRQSFRLNTDSAKLPRYYLNFALLYIGMGRQDSATWYTEQLKQHIDDSLTDNYLKASIYRYLAVTEKEKGNFNAAFNYQDRYTNVVEEITKEQLQQSVYETQRKYDYEIMRNRHERQVTVFQFWFIILLLAILIGGAFFSWYTLRQRTRLLHTQQHIETLREIAAELNRSFESKISAKDQDLRELLLWKFDVVKKSALMDQHSTSKMSAAELIKIFHQIVYRGNKNDYWQNILSIFDQMNPGISEKMRKLFPNLTETEYKIARLTYAGMSVKEISVILHLSSHTVQTYRTGLRKKFGIGDFSVDTVTYLRDVLDNT